MICVSVELPNGLELWWDGVTRVYIDAPAKFRGKTKVSLHKCVFILKSTV
jgi:hypothetical protein